MKANWLIKRIIFTLMVALTVFLDSSSLWAQVKIGANPTVINAANNLEVEASTTGRKTSVDKVTGQVTIKDGTEGMGKVLTSDASGGASWQDSKISIISGSIGTYPNLTINAPHVYSNANITLPAGKWLIFYNATYLNQTTTTANIWWDLSTSSITDTRTSAAERVVSSGGAPNIFMPVSAIYSVEPTVNTTYYLWAAAWSTPVTGSGSALYTGEGRIFAIPVQ